MWYTFFSVFSFIFVPFIVNKDVQRKYHQFIIIMTRRRCGPLRRLSTMSTLLCTLPHLFPAGSCSVACLLCLSRTTRKSSPVHTWAAATFHCNDLLQGWYPFDYTCPNSAWRFLTTMSVMFSRPVVSAMSTFFTWSCHLTPSIWRWHPMWKDCSLRISFANRVHVSAPYSRIWRSQVW